MDRRCHLRALEYFDVEFLYELENEETMWEVSQTQIPYSKYFISKYLENINRDVYDVCQLRLVVMWEGTPVGLVDMYDYSPKNKRACVGIAILPKYRGIGIGTIALRMFIQYLFKYIDLRQIYAEVLVDNLNSIRLFESVDFKSIGIKKDWFYSNGTYKDAVFYQLIRK